MGQDETFKDMWARGDAKRSRDHRVAKVVVIIGITQMVLSTVLLIIFNLPMISLNAFLGGNLVFGMFTTISGAIVMDMNRPRSKPPGFYDSKR